jgi:tetratricopeptide (TPR) repeat protein
VRSALLELETAALGRGDRWLERLREAELRAARDLAAQEADALLPLVAMHEALYRSYRGRRLYSLVQHSRSQVEQLAELFVARGGSAAIAADILAGVGSYLQEVNLPAESRRLLLRALDHDPDNLAALFGMATSHEKYAEYLRAEDYLERLDKLRPGTDQVVLRWAMNLHRTGRRRRAEEILQGMTERCVASWTCSLAHQELARGWLESGAERQAAELLEKGIQRMPERPALRFLLAHAYDRLGRPTRALEVISGVAPGETISERLRYDTWANAHLEEARATVAAAAEAARAALGRAVAATAAEGES